jgi:sigma-E factor negative regulatory protein RseA
MERISSLMDGELDAHQAGQELARLKNDPETLASWETYHLIGDAMRGDCVVSRQFSARLHERLAAEPTVLAPRRSAPRRVSAYAWSAAASFSAVALVGWMAFYSPMSPRPLDDPLAKGPAPQLPAPPIVPVELANVPSDGRMNEYLIAHQEYSPSTAIQGVVPYIRTVSATQPAKGRE